MKRWTFERKFTPHHGSHDMCQMWLVTCQVSDVRCLVSCFFVFIWQWVGVSRWSVCCQWGLPRLVVEQLWLHRWPGFLNTLIWIILFSINLQNPITPKPLELGTWNFDTIFVTSYVSGVRCHMSHVRCHVSGLTLYIHIYIFATYCWSYMIEGLLSMWPIFCCIFLSSNLGTNWWS